MNILTTQKEQAIGTDLDPIQNYTPQEDETLRMEKHTKIIRTKEQAKEAVKILAFLLEGNNGEQFNSTLALKISTMCAETISEITQTQAMTDIQQNTTTK